MRRPAPPFSTGRVFSATTTNRAKRGHDPKASPRRDETPFGAKLGGVAGSAASRGRDRDRDDRSMSRAAPQLHRAANGLGTIPDPLESGARTLRGAADAVVADLDPEPA